jgi:hemerythrin-like metal-binding protein
MSTFLPSVQFDPATTIDALVECDAITEALNEEHKTLYEGLFVLNNAVTAGANQEFLTSILDNIDIFCFAHFQNEERFFRDRAYVKSDAHEAAHQQLIQRLRTVRKAINTRQLTASDITLLIDMFNNHIVAFDKPAHVWSLWQHFEAGDETSQQIKELCSLDRLGKVSW